MRYLIFLLFMAQIGLGQEKIVLYPQQPGSNRLGEAPFMEFFPASTPNGAAILICPGGAYTHLALTHEGSDVAKFYGSQGYHTFVLHYRLNNFEQQGHRFPDQLNDVTTAIRLIKQQAASRKINPEKIGILGFSAGGHLASMAATMFVNGNPKAIQALDRISSRPAFSILIYPVITLKGPAAHTYSREMLLGKNPDSGLVDSLSTNNRVTDFTPPAFIVFSNDDTGVPPENGILYYQALRAHGIPASFHLFDHGGHGYGMAPDDPVLNSWPALSVKWLQRQGF